MNPKINFLMQTFSTLLDMIVPGAKFVIVCTPSEAVKASVLSNLPPHRVKIVLDKLKEGA